MNPDFTAVVTCRYSESINISAIRQHLARIAPAIRLEEMLTSAPTKDSAIMGAIVNCDGLTIAILETKAPLPLRSLIFGPTPTLFWPTASEELEQHTSHLRVVAVEPEKSGKSIAEQALVLTMLTTAVCLAVPAIGVLWCASDHLMSASRFVQIATTPAGRGQMLCTIWVRLFVAETEGGLLLATHGLQVFKAFELEFNPTKNLDLTTLSTRAMQLSHLLINDSMVLKVGDITAPENFAVGEGKGRFEACPVLTLSVPL